MISRVLENELMDSLDEAMEYNEMDHREVNRRFVADLLSTVDPKCDVLDLGTGTALVPIELCRQHDDCRVVAVDFAVAMLEVARYNVEIGGFNDRIMLDRVDAKALPYQDGAFEVVMSNSIVHHIAEPESVLREAVRVTAPGGVVFFRDLVRPADEGELQELVERYAGNEEHRAQQMFRDSLRAALTVEEMQDLVEALGGSRDDVSATSDRHWTWIFHRP